MLLETLSLAVVGYVAYSVYSGKGPSTVTGALDEKITNGYQLRDITYTDNTDIAQPDVKNDTLLASGLVAQDRGLNGIQRGYSQLYPTSEISQLYRTDNLYL